MPRVPRHCIVTQEGWPFIGLGLPLLAAGWWLQIPWLLWSGGIWAVACALFFRNPSRKIPTTPGAVVAPADGKVIAIESVEEPYFGRGAMQRISIFLSVADVHINRTPIDGVIGGVKYTPGRFLVAYAPKASTDNERNAIWVCNADRQHEVVMVQIAGLVARRIVCYLREGEQVARGMRCGLIRFGSRVDLYLPLDCAITVQVGDRVQGGASVMARFAVEGK
ncbi:MAG: phosphatidylserine decarboxylase family protein [Deltaproteobacteria bacterium]|nr:phosphatidylserine decarboxylase family protein [Deltaproteobacteria bacterium]